ncbi:MAG TPA: glycoside hydrolase family 2 TIM barrel-domain containing protein [Vicinamibacterales bacterium]|nr:glycoside hydrolase family 2 TIM barrel-domain containing protein [Vicinamibacterales bacterium]
MAAAQPTAAARVVIPLDADWRFQLANPANAAMPALNDSMWRTVRLPHDWSAEGPFSADFGSGNGYAPGGIGWYRKHFTLASNLDGKVATIEFDGVYDHAEVWANGHFVCERPYGYSSFECPLSPHLRVGTADNVVAVRVDHSRFADSRWYTGSGIYRHVRLRLTDPLHIAHWGTFVTTPVVSARAATVKIATTIANESTASRSFVLESEIVLGNDIVARSSTPASLAANGRGALSQDIELPAPRRWTLDSPVLYTLRQRVRVDSAVVDDAETTFGVRTMRFDAANGFFLNDQPTKLKGVCVHVDAGSLGVAVPAGVWERRLRELKALGVNAIRTSHNPPAPEFLDLADRIGLLVLDEAFDEFTPTKNKWVNGRNVGVPSRFGYGEEFKEWSVTDASDMVRRDRNHPAIFAWSVGNEVDYPNDPFSHPVLGTRYRRENPPAENLVTLARPLVDAIHMLDPTRPVTMALASLEMSDAVGLPALLDISGYNYQEARYADDHARVPGRIIFGSENGHQYRNWTIVRDNAYVAGQFLWTGIDYLGEAGVFPNRANGAGLLDLCGFKKPMAWFRQSLWSDAPMVYLAASPAPANGAPRTAVRLEEHWNWPMGLPIDVTAYSNAEEVELQLNLRPLGKKSRADAVDGVLHWEVPFEPGVLRAIARNGGRLVEDFTLTTAGDASHIQLVPDVTSIAADNEAVVHIEYRIVDNRVTRVPTANNAVTFEVQGPARVLGIGNADLNDPASGAGLLHRAFQGRGLAILQSSGTPGTITVRASSPGLESTTITIAAVARR